VRHYGFPPIAGKSAGVLILGTFPSPVSRERGEYYGNPQNSFWRIMFEVLGLPFEKDYAAKTGLLIDHGVALWDVVESCEAASAADTDIKNPLYNTDIPGLAAQLGVRRILFNGGNAYTMYRRGIGETGRLVLPSTSPANARYSFAEKLAAWKKYLAENESFLLTL